MPDDISHILRNWEYNLEENVRIIKGNDGKEKFQLRIVNGVLEGILQMELEGRPNGKKPHNYDFALDFYKAQQIEAENRGRHFSLDKKACEELFEESSQVYNRYVILLQTGNFERVVRDTERNMDLFRFMNKYAADEENRMNLEKWWPYILRINSIARIMIAIDKNDYDPALAIVQETRKKIEELKEVETPEFYVEKEISFNVLKDLEKNIRGKKPKTEIERMKDELRQAVAAQKYELAAELRDKIRALKKN